VKSQVTGSVTGDLKVTQTGKSSCPSLIDATNSLSYNRALSKHNRRFCSEVQYQKCQYPPPVFTLPRAWTR
jgi:hypothetical protein